MANEAPMTPESADEAPINPVLRLLTPTTFDATTEAPITPDVLAVVPMTPESCTLTQNTPDASSEAPMSLRSKKPPKNPKLYFSRDWKKHEEVL